MRRRESRKREKKKREKEREEKKREKAEREKKEGESTLENYKICFFFFFFPSENYDIQRYCMCLALKESGEECSGN